MTDEDLDVQTYITEFQTNAAKVARQAKDAAELYAQGDPASAALTIAMTRDEIDCLLDGRQDVLNVIQERDGVTAQDGLSRIRGWRGGTSETT